MIADELLHHTRARVEEDVQLHVDRPKRVLGSGTQMPISIAANLGYRFYANNLDKFYTCDWQLAPRA